MSRRAHRTDAGCAIADVLFAASYAYGIGGEFAVGAASSRTRTRDTQRPLIVAHAFETRAPERSRVRERPRATRALGWSLGFARADAQVGSSDA